MGFDLVAPYYRFFEYLAFGKGLQRHREHFLEAARNATSALVLGDGDGRFLERLLAANKRVVVDAIDASGKMTELAVLRTGRSGESDCARVHFVQNDARGVAFPESKYDLIVSHFFLDCFEEAELSELMKRLASCLKPEGVWIVSEFQQPAAWLEAMHARVWLGAMYAFFRASAGLKVKRLPDHRGMLTANGFMLAAEYRSRLNFIGSELWRFALLPGDIKN